jgi:hypothetical protein
MPKKIQTLEKDTIKAIPVASQYGNEEIQVNYYTENGEKIPNDCVGKKVIIGSLSFNC